MLSPRNVCTAVDYISLLASVINCSVLALSNNNNYELSPLKISIASQECTKIQYLYC